MHKLTVRTLQACTLKFFLYFFCDERMRALHFTKSIKRLYDVKTQSCTLYEELKGLDSSQ